MAGPTVNGTSALKPLTEGLTKRAEEKLTTSGAAKVLGNKALNAAPKAAGKALGVGGLMLNSAPMHEESAMEHRTPEEIRKQVRANHNKNTWGKAAEDAKSKPVFTPKSAFTPEKDAAYRKALEEQIKNAAAKNAEIKQGTPEAPKTEEVQEPSLYDKMKGTVLHGVNTAKNTVESGVNAAKNTVSSGIDEAKKNVNKAKIIAADKVGGLANAVEEVPVAGDLMKLGEKLAEASGYTKGLEMKRGAQAVNNMVSGKGGNGGNGKGDDTRKKGYYDSPSGNGAGTGNGSGNGGKGSSGGISQNQPDYSNIINFYRTGGYGDPNSREAKSAMGSAILSEIGKMFSGISNATPVNKGGTYNVSQFDKERDQAMNQKYVFNRLDKELQNNKGMQSYLNNLRKDFENWAIENKIKWGNDDEKMEALKKFVANGGNQIENGWMTKLADAGISIGGSVASHLLLRLLLK